MQINKAPFYGMWLGHVSDKRISKQPQPRLTNIHFKAWKTRTKYPCELRTCPCNFWRNFNCCSWHLCLHYPWGNPWLHSFNTNPLCTDLLKPELRWWQEKSSTHGHKTLKTALVSLIYTKPRTKSTLLYRENLRDNLKYCVHIHIARFSQSYPSTSTSVKVWSVNKSQV